MASSVGEDLKGAFIFASDCLKTAVIKDKRLLSVHLTALRAKVPQRGMLQLKHSASLWRQKSNLRQTGSPQALVEPLTPGDDEGVLVWARAFVFDYSRQRVSTKLTVERSQNPLC